MRSPDWSIHSITLKAIATLTIATWNLYNFPCYSLDWLRERVGNDIRSGELVTMWYQQGQSHSIVNTFRRAPPYMELLEEYLKFANCHLRRPHPLIEKNTYSNWAPQDAKNCFNPPTWPPYQEWVKVVKKSSRRPFLLLHSFMQRIIVLVVEVSKPFLT